MEDMTKVSKVSKKSKGNNRLGEEDFPEEYPCGGASDSSSSSSNGSLLTEEELQQGRDCLGKVWELVKQEGLLELPEDEVFMLRFVRAKKYNPDVVYQNIKKYYEARIKYPKSFGDFYPSRYLHVWNSGALQLLKHRDDCHRRTVVFRMAKWNPNEISMDDMIMAGYLVAEHMSWDPLNQLVGAVMVFDEGGLNLSHVKALTLPVMHKVVSLFQDCFPGKYKALHLVNQPVVLDILYTLVKRLISKRLVSRIKLHRDVNSLTELVSPEILPKSLGGYLQEEEAFDDELVQTMLDAEDKFKEMSTYGFIKKTKE